MLLLKTILSVPGTKVDRMSYLCSNFKCYGQTERLLNESPENVYGKEIVDRVARSSINAHTLRTTLESTALGVPGGIALVGTLPADIMQMNVHIVVLAQKLAYLYGWDNLFDDNGNIDDETYTKLSLLIGVMSGVVAAEEAMKTISKNFAGHLVKRLPTLPLTKSLIYRAIKEVAKMLGKQVTKDSFAKAVGKIAPFVGGAISGTMTLITFKPMACRLQRSLSKRCKAA